MIPGSASRESLPRARKHLPRLPSFASHDSPEDACRLARPRPSAASRPSNSIDLKRGKVFDCEPSLTLVQNNNFTNSQSVSHIFRLNPSYNAASRLSGYRNEPLDKTLRQRSTLLQYFAMSGGSDERVNGLRASYMTQLQNRNESVERRMRLSRMKSLSRSRIGIEAKEREFALRQANASLADGILELRGRLAVLERFREKARRSSQKVTRLRRSVEERDVPEEVFRLRLENEAVQKRRMEGRMVEMCRRAKQESDNPEIRRLLKEIRAAEEGVERLGGHLSDWVDFT